MTDNSQSESTPLLPRAGAGNESNANQEVATTDGNQPAVAQPAQPAQPPPSRAESFFAVTKSLIIRALIIYFVSNLFRRGSTPTTPVDTTGKQVGPRHASWNLFENGTVFDLYVYISDQHDYVDFENPQSLIWYKDGLIYGDWTSGADGDGTYTQSTKIQATQNLLNNGSIYIHAYVTKNGYSPDPRTSAKYAKNEAGHNWQMLNKFKKVKYRRTHNLLTGESDQSVEDQIRAEVTQFDIKSHWHPNLTINLVTDQTNWVQGSVPPPLNEYVKFLPGDSVYLPIIFFNDYWNMARDYKPINETTPVLDLTLTYQPLSLFKWQLYAAQAMKSKWTSSFLGDAFATEENDEDQDSLKETLLDTNPYLLGITIMVSILHSVFEMLAFKNDIQFWNNRKSLEGLSVRSVFFAVFQSLIVLLYVLDNETNFMIRVSCFIGLGIEVWKIQKVVNITLDKENRILGVIPKITITDKGSYVKSSTKEYDDLAFKYLGWLCFPLLIGYSIYSLLYNEHKGWYSFILNMFYGYLLTFGFIMMTPQLFINYKLKSVAHLPWRMMTYKFFNTFIDDIFAFVIKMPTMYRLGCFRDDIIFFIFLYQRWIYKVDHKRLNEFGYSGEMENNETAPEAIMGATKEDPKPAVDKKNE